MNKKLVNAFLLVFALCSMALSAQQSPPSAAPPAYDGKPGTKAGQQCVNPKDGAVMVWVPAGNFLMGSTDADKLSRPDAKPQHTVYLDGYWIYQNDVTVAQYKTYCAATGENMPKEAPTWGWKDTHPMVMVSWMQACAYAKWSAAKLPTEAQWEKAARGTDGRIYPWGDIWDAGKCNNSTTGPKQTMPVGSFPDGASPYGCLDMAGNVWQWCADWYAKDYYKNSPSRNPTGPDVGDQIGNVGQCRVSRGGAWDSVHPGRFRGTFRNSSGSPTNQGNDLGFRCVVSPPDGKKN